LSVRSFAPWRQAAKSIAVSLERIEEVKQIFKKFGDNVVGYAARTLVQGAVEAAVSAATI